MHSLRIIDVFPGPFMTPPTRLLCGRTPAQRIQEALKKRIATLHREGRAKPRLDVIWVGEDAPSHIYVQRKRQACQSIGMDSQLHHFPADTPEATLRSHLKDLSSHPQVHGVLLQLPLPTPLPGFAILSELCPYKDIDGLTAWSQGQLALGLPALFPCTPLGCLMLLRSAIEDLRGVHATVIGHSPLVGAPMVHMLISQGCTVTVLHKASKNPEKLCLTSDVVIAAAGARALVNRQWLKPGAVVIDVGIHRGGTHITGDVDSTDVQDHVQAITPVPGGVGPMTIAMLLRNCLIAYEHLENARPFPTLHQLLREEIPPL